MRKIWTYLMITILIFTTFGALDIAYGAADELGSVAEPAKLVVGRGVKTPVFKAGGEVLLVVPVENIGGTAAENVSISLSLEDVKDAPFRMERTESKKKISSIDARKRENVIFFLDIPKTVEPKIYGMTVQVEAASGYSASEKIYIKIENDFKVPALRLAKLEVDGEKLLAGTAKKVSLTIENTGDLLAKDVEVRLGGFGSSGLTLVSPIDVANLKEIEGKRQEMASFKISAEEDLESGTIPLDLILTYKDEDNKSYTKESKIYFQVESKNSQSPDLTFENIAYPQSGVNPNEDFTISFKVKNNDEGEIKGIKVGVDAGTDILPKSASIKNISLLPMGKEEEVSFTLFAKEGIESKNYPIKIYIEYEQKSGKDKTTESISQYVGIFVNEESNTKLTPKIIIDNYTYGGEYTTAGVDFPLTLSFLNTNTHRRVRNIRVSISSEGEIFSPVGGSSSFFIDEIPPQERLQKTITLKPKADAAYKTHNVFADIEYEDDKGNKYSTKEFVGIPVIQQIGLMVGEIEWPQEIYVGNNTAISIDFYNVGRSLIRNLIVRTEGDFEAKGNSSYIGNLEAGKDNYYDVTIVPQKPGMLAGKIIFEYDDEIGNHHAAEKEFNLTVNEPELPPMPPEGEMDVAPLASGNSFKKYGIPIGGVLLAGIMGIVYYKKKRRKLEALSEDE
ncbi:COG1361 S-layer family protein [Geosporobacter ferrireducens]|uniref:CARDB domain-containing protein n=1 Tax=Geosporobacter ferrireducens TaxID=1424294 RepID=A0A1D8GH09_9FIRM|nr:CARDB domain-containing protein [Geosporobacter ferrireducens]AOT70197.1 hypothetical protein Gferi_11685 [Geosporobacter ferrireducens]